MNFSLTEAIGVIGITVSIMSLAALYSQVLVKKYEIKRDYRSSIMDWFSKTTEVLIELRMLLANSPDPYNNGKTLLLSKLSAQIEIGRLYFPNIDKGDGFGSEKPKAYQGYRNLILDFLVYSFDIFSKPNAQQYQQHLIRLQREYTPLTCSIIDPEEFLNETKKHSNRFFAKKLSYEDFLIQDPSNKDLFFRNKSLCSNE